MPLFLIILQDEKKDQDEEMKSEDTAKHGDISPISGSISNLAEQGKASTSKPGRKAEPSFEKLQNYSRVTPAQLAYVTFPAESRYQPVRPVSTKPPVRAKGAKNSVVTEGFVGVGGILIMIDQRPDEDTELISPLEPSVVASITTPQATSQETQSRPNIALDESASEADPPESFEVRITMFYPKYADAEETICSILLVMIHSVYLGVITTCFEIDLIIVLCCTFKEVIVTRY